MEKDQENLFQQLSASWTLVTALENDIRMWKEHSQHDEKDREMLQRQLTKVIEEKQAQERFIVKQNENVILEIMYLSEQCSSLKAENTKLERCTLL